MKLGIIQGRLSPPIDGQVQEFPFETWEHEFKLLDIVKLDFIEWIITEKYVANDLSHAIKPPDNLISSICLDILIHHQFSNTEYIIDCLRTGIKFCRLYDVHVLTLPLLEHSSVQDFCLRRQFQNCLNIIAQENNDLLFSLETDLSPDILASMMHENEFQYRITYDTGNITAAGISHSEYIYKLHKWINNVHIKDRKFTGISYPPGLGDTNFELIFSALKSKLYDGNFTLQLARQETGQEINTIAEYVKWFQTQWHRRSESCTNMI